MQNKNNVQLAKKMIKKNKKANNFFMKKHKITIVGGGLSGLACGIFCQKHGFETTIIEKNNTVGGNLTGWYRNGFYIDNCIHWLNGSKQDTNNNKLFQQIGAFDKSTQFHQSSTFYTSELDGKQIRFSQDLSITKKDMLQNCPQDKKQITKFINATKICCKILQAKNCICVPFYAIKLLLVYKKNTLNQVAKKCKSQLLKNAFTDYVLGDYSVYILLLAYSSFLIGDGKVLKNGSLNMANNITEYFKKLGGKVVVNNQIQKCKFDNDKIVLSSPQQRFETDVVVFACDPKITFEKILKTNIPAKLQKIYQNPKDFPIISSFHVAFAVQLPKVDIPDSFVFDCPKIQIATKTYNRIMVRNYDYGNNYAPNGSCVLQIFLLTTQNDFDFFASLSPQQYQQQKKDISEKLSQILQQKFDFLKNKISILDCWTPLTYTRYFDSYKGSYMSFGITKKLFFASNDLQIKPYKNAFFATQWQTMFGGLPNALGQGKKCADFLDKKFD